MPDAKVKALDLKIRPVAEELLSAIAPACEKAEIAGSLRRQKPMVGDIEIVCLPKYDRDMFGDETETYSELDSVLKQLVADRMIKYDTEVKRNGAKYKRFKVPSLNGFVFELFMATPDNYGNILTIRTGSAEYSEFLVTHTKHYGMRQRDGMLYDSDNNLVKCPTEQAFFDAIDIPWTPPSERNG